MSFKEMFYENLKKVQLEFNVKIHCEISVKLIFHEILWKKKNTLKEKFHSASFAIGKWSNVLEICE